MAKKNEKETAWEEVAWCPHCGADINYDCHRLLVRCTNPECGRYSIR